MWNCVFLSSPTKIKSDTIISFSFPLCRWFLWFRGGAFHIVSPQCGVGDGDPWHPSPAGRARRVPAFCSPLILGAGSCHLSRRARRVIGPGAGGGSGSDCGWCGTGRPSSQHAHLPRLQTLCHRPRSDLQPAAQTALPRVPQGKSLIPDNRLPFNIIIIINIIY